MHLTNLLTHLGWKVVYSETRPGREARYTTPPAWLIPDEDRDCIANDDYWTNDGTSWKLENR